MNARPVEHPAAAISLVGALAVAHLAGVLFSLGDPPSLRLWHDVAGWAGSIIGVVGTVAAASAFSRGDHLRRVWTLFAAGAALLLVGTALRSAWTHLAPDRSFLESPLLPVRMVVVTAANVVSVWALVLLVGTCRRAGLQPEPSWKANALWLLTGVAALSIAVPQLIADVRRFDDGAALAMSSVTSIASTLGDFTTILLIAPILRVAYLLRGGRLAWVWWMMALSGAIWLVYDGRSWLADLVPGDAANNLQLLMVTRSSGLALVGLAGWLQRSALMTAARPQQVPATIE